MISLYNASEITKLKSASVFGDLNVIDGVYKKSNINNAHLLPTIYKKGMRTWWTRRTQGVFDGSLNHVEALSDTRAERKIWWPTEETVSYLETTTFDFIDTAYYGGTIYDHFGHFLLDSLSRLYPLLPEIVSNSIPIIFHYPKDSLTREKVLDGYMGKYFSLLGIKHSRIIFLDEPLRVANLIYHVPTFSDANFSVTGISDMYPTLPAVEKTNKRGFISKSQLSSGTGNTTQGQEIDDIFRHFGFDIIYPENLELSEQFSVIQSYDVLVGLPSSFFHLKLFCSDGAKLKIMFPEIDEYLHINFLNIDVASNFNDQFIPLTGKEAKSMEGFAKSFSVELAEVFEVASAFS